MTPDQWLFRYEKHLIARAHISATQAFKISHAVPFLDLVDGYEDDPEGAAEEEMQCWSDDR